MRLAPVNRLYLLLALILGVGLLLGLTYCTGGSQSRGEAKAVKAENKRVAKSVQISRDAAERVDRQGAQVRERAKRAEESIDEAIRIGGAEPSAADLYVMREADKAYRAALCANRRVQRADGGDDAACAAEGN